MRRTAAQNADTSNDHLVGYGDDLSTRNNSLNIMTHTTADTIRCNFVDSADAQTNNTHVYGDATYDDVWVPVMSVYRTSTDRQIYIQDASGTTGNDTTPASLSGAVLDMVKVGSRLHDSSSAFLGEIAEVAIYNTNLDNTQLNQFWTSVNTGPAPDTIASANCIGYWPLDTEQTNHTNQSGATWTLVAINSPTFVTRDGSGDNAGPHPNITGAANTNILVPTMRRRGGA
jgi:hypothetical protein